jgi:hypothetical protein
MAMNKESKFAARITCTLMIVMLGAYGWPNLGCWFGIFAPLSLWNIWTTDNFLSYKWWITDPKKQPPDEEE